MSDAERTSVLVRFPDDLLTGIEAWQGGAPAGEPPRPATRHAAILALVRIGLGLDPAPPQNKPRTPLQIRMAALRERGLTNSEIALEVGVSRQRVHQVLGAPQQQKEPPH